MRIAMHPAFILHTRPYRETSILLDVFAEEYGRISLIARGVRKEKSRLRGLLQPFVPLLISWQGKTELMTLAAAETNGVPIRLTGECLLSGLYLNELLMKLLHKHDPCPQLYTIYYQTLLKLQAQKLQQKTLRLFEKNLLEELGYGLQFKHDNRGDMFNPEAFYHFNTELGFTQCESSESAAIFSGRNVLAFANEELECEEVLRDAKRLMRIALAALLGKYELQSRKLFMNRTEMKVHE